MNKKNINYTDKLNMFNEQKFIYSNELNVNNELLEYLLTILEIFKDKLDTDKSALWRLFNYGNNLFLSIIVPNIDKLKSMDLNESVKLLEDTLKDWGYIKMIELNYYVSRDVLAILNFIKMSDLEPYDALNKFFNSNTYNAMEHDLADMNNMNGKYIASELMYEYGYDKCLGYSCIEKEEEVVSDNILVNLN